MKMGQNKLESDFRKKLSAREIEPSANAWSRLDQMLDDADEKKSRNYKWLYIAAAVAAFILVATVLFNSTRTYNESPGIAVETKDDQAGENVNTQIDQDSIEMPAGPVNLPSEKLLNPSNNSIAEKALRSQGKPEKSAVSNQAVAVVESQPGVQSSNQINQNQINQNQGAPIAEEAQPKAVTGIEQMIAAAPKKSSTLKVDPKSLLSQVDGELELSFREKVIKSVSKNYKEVKVALANRNLE